MFDRTGPLVPYGMVLASGEPGPRRRVPRTRSKYLRDHANRGPWIESWNDHPDHPYNTLLGELGVRAHAYAPIHDGDELIGVLVVGSAAKQAEEELSEIMPAVVECADICGTLIGVRVVERTEAIAERDRLARIADRHEFTTVFQPLIDTVNSSVVGYEALTRFADGAAPDARFAEAHAAGVGARLEIAAIKSALDAAALLPGHLWLNVNASPQTVISAELKQLIEQTRRELVLEVTEHKEITDYPAFRLAVQGLGARVRLAVDDAGAGFAGLRHIVELRPSFVKLDRQLIADIDSDDARQAMVAGMVHFSRNSGCWLIAEGVETEAELACLRSLQLRYMQGYLLGQPAPPERFAEDAGRWIGR
jgi:EAL domain-containing protein (putative c-di-GMP-specific phosphodiesterase class I)